jgi:5-methylcytosine-specific restriction endonuclease McrA
MQALISQQVLVLNRLWQAVNVCSAARALTLVYQGHAQVVESAKEGYLTHSFHEWREVSQAYNGHDVISTISFKIRVPKIILLLFFDRIPKKEVKFTRHNIFERDNCTCQYCGKKFDKRELNLDHVVPRDQGGQTTWENIVCSCIDCNSRKANRTPQMAGMKLLRKPRRPRWRPFLNVHFNRCGEDAWKHFLDLAYWNVELTD